MSLRYEQYRALLYTRQFLFDCLDPKKRPKTAKELKQRVSLCLHHFPPLMDNGEPIFSEDGIRLCQKGRKEWKS